ncbi:MAG TPA: PTS system mannose/fructose/sorbose family transporter subunit IID [Gemmatimonadales bacterium]|nr:PTS system mannose/fructose/sorbose family transporter subunit IID [Gemmatimonadales bacterium]
MRAAWWRLFSLQGSWNYDRMIGVGMGFAAKPLLEELRHASPERHAEAVARSAEFFNSHPYLAGLALGAVTRAEYDQVPGEQILRLRNALCSPLGALGDQLFWAGLLPAVIGSALAGVALGAGWPAVLVAVVCFTAVRCYVSDWALRRGLATGMTVGRAIADSRLRRAIAVAGIGASLLVGLAIPLVATRLAVGLTTRHVALMLLVAAVGLLLGKVAGTRYSSPRFALVALAVVLLIRWITP